MKNENKLRLFSFFIHLTLLILKASSYRKLYLLYSAMFYLLIDYQLSLNRFLPTFAYLLILAHFSGVSLNNIGS
jgi:hypothetical protein